MLPWQFFAKLAAVLAVPGQLGLLVRRGVVATVALWIRQAALLCALYALWQVVLNHLVVHTEGAISRALWIWRTERRLHLPSEVAVQRAALHHPNLVKFCNDYYSVVHFPALIIMLAWLLLRHRDRYWPAITTIVLTTGICALVQAIPVAPPRFLPGLGFVDTGLLFSRSDYGASGITDPGQLIAMPSVHYAWALMVAVLAIRATRSWWRWLVLVHPVATALVVVITGNHFWLDGIVADVIFAVTLLVQEKVGEPLVRRLVEAAGRLRSRALRPPDFAPEGLAVVESSDVSAR
jgi:hypothetical protein